MRNWLSSRSGLIAPLLGLAALTLHSAGCGDSESDGPDVGGLQHLMVTDIGQSALFTIDPETGDRSIVADDLTGDGPTLSSPQAVVFDPDTDRALVVSDGRDALLAVALDTGDRVILSDMDNGVGPGMREPIAAVRDGDRLLILDTGLAAVLTIDLASGDRSILSDPSTGAGQNFVVPRGIAIDAGRNRALVADVTVKGLVAIDLTSGDRTIFAGENASGPEISPAGVTVDTDNDRALVVDGLINAVVAIDLGTGQKTVISDNDNGEGPAFEGPNSIAFDSAADRIVVIEDSSSALGPLVVDPISGDRVLVSSTNRGVGSLLQAPRSVVLVDPASLAASRALHRAQLMR